MVGKVSRLRRYNKMDPVSTSFRRKTVTACSEYKSEHQQLVDGKFF